MNTIENVGQEEKKTDSILDTVYKWSLGSIHIGKSWMVESRQNYIYDTSLIKIAI